jgi:DNA-binding NtrC family response regulator
VLGDFQLVLARSAKAAEPQALQTTGTFAAVLTFARTVARGDISVLIAGESGVGKDVVAQAIHEASQRADRPLVRLNCGSFSEALLEGELFGHERGAFTGATTSRAGHIEAAHGGTLFLDEVGELTGPAQARLLHVLERREVTRLGSTVARPVDVRFVAATHRDLPALVQRGAFRQDLYFRLAGVTVAVPPLRARAEEIAPLAELFARRFSESAGRSPPSISAEAQQVLRAHAWPGNVRELRNAIERAVLLARDVIRPEHLKLETPVEQTAGVALSPAEAAERDAIVAALEANAGNQTAAAKALGIARSTLVTKLSVFRLARPRKKG